MMMNTDDGRPADHALQSHIAIKAEPLSGEYIDFHQVFGVGSVGAAAGFHEQMNQRYSDGTPSPEPYRSKSDGSSSSVDSANSTALFESADALLRPLLAAADDDADAADVADDSNRRQPATGAKPKRFPCPECGKMFARVSHVRRHQLLHSGSKPFECDVCGDRFTRKENHDRHMIMHTKMRPYICEQCGKGFTQLNRLKSHRSTHTGERPFSCERCSKRFLRIDHLRVHMRTHRGDGEDAAGGPVDVGQRPDEQEGGGDGADEVDDEEEDEDDEDSLQPDVKKPMRNAEHLLPSAMPFIEMPRSDDFVITMVTTKPEALVTAIDYSSSSSSPTSFKLASTAAAIDIVPAVPQPPPPPADTKPFQCPVCHKQFGRRDHFQRHVTVHSGVRPFQCDLCPKRFSRKDNKYSHMVSCLLKNYGVAVDDGCELPRGMLQRTMDERVRAVLGDAFIEPETQLLEMDEELEDAEYAEDATGLDDPISLMVQQAPAIDDGPADDYPRVAGILKLRDLNELAILPVATEAALVAETLRCDQCDLTFATEGSLQLHEQLHTNERHQAVHSGLDHSHHLQQHLLQLQPIELTTTPGVAAAADTSRLYRCDVCDKTFQNKSHLVRHAVLHTSERPFTCDRCDKTFSRKEHLQRHVIVHTGIKPFRCAYCDRAFVEQNQQRRHVLEEHAAEAAAAALAQPVDCSGGGGDADADGTDGGDECVMDTGEAVRAADGLFHCDRCDKRYALKYRLRRHYAGHTGDKAYGCDFCAQRFSRAEHKRRHMAIHTNERRHECEFCERRFVRADHMLAHVKTHEGVLPYQCTVCRQRFGSAKEKQEHMRRHTGAYRCEMCLERFESFAELSEHRRDIHLQADTQKAEIVVGRQEHYPCPVCKTFYSIVRLCEHLRTHVADSDTEEDGAAAEEVSGVGGGGDGGGCVSMVYADGEAVPRYRAAGDDDGAGYEDELEGDERRHHTPLMASPWSPHMKHEYGEAGTEQY